MPDAHASRLISLNVFGLSNIGHISFSRVFVAPLAPARLHWYSCVLLGGPWAAVARALSVFSNRTSLLQSNLAGCRTVLGGALRPGIGEKLVLRKVLETSLCECFSKDKDIQSATCLFQLRALGQRANSRRRVAQSHMAEQLKATKVGKRHELLLQNEPAPQNS